MYRQEIISNIKPLLSFHLEKGGYVLVDLRFYKNKGELIFEILVDRTEGGITLDECVQLNRQFAEIIEHSGYISESYTLDVSSPGLDRPLMNLLDFRRVVTKKVRIFLKEPVDERIEYLGIVESVADDKIVIRTQTKTLEIPLDKINKAKQVIYE